MMMQNCLNCLFWNAFSQDCHGNVCSTSERLSARLSMDLTATQSLLTTKKRLMSLCPLPESFAIEQKSRQRYLTLQFSSLFRKNLYLSGLCPKEPIFDHTSTTSTISDALSADLRKRGMKFVGSTTIHAFLQSIGVFNSHALDCYLYQGK